MMSQNLPPDGFEDDMGGPPDGFEDEATRGWRGVASKAIDLFSDSMKNSPLGMAASGANSMMTGAANVLDKTGIPVPDSISRGAQVLFRPARALGVGVANQMTGNTPMEVTRRTLNTVRGGQPEDAVDRFGSSMGENAAVMGASVAAPTVGGPLAMMAQQAQSGKVSPLPLAAPAFEGARRILRPIQRKLVPPLLKSTKDIPEEASSMVIDNPDILNRPGTSQSVQQRAQDIIEGVKEAGNKVGGEFGVAYRQTGMNSPVEEIMRERQNYSPTFSSRSYRGPETEIPGDVVSRQINIPGRNYTGIRKIDDVIETPQNIPGQQYTGLESTVSEVPGSWSRPGSAALDVEMVRDPLTMQIIPNPKGVPLPGETRQYTGLRPDISQVQGSVPGRSYAGLSKIEDVANNRISIPGQNYTGLEQQPPQTVPGESVSFRDVSGTRPINTSPKDFNQLRNEYQSAMRGDLFKNRDVAGSYSESGNLEKLKKLTELKRNLQNQAIYPPAGQELSPSEGAHNAAIKSMAADIDKLRGNVPGGENLALADDAWAEMEGIRENLWRAFKDPYTGQDYLNRIMKGNIDWLTAGRNAGRVGAIQRVEQITGKELLKPALEEMAAAYLKNPRMMGLPSTRLMAVVNSIVPARFLTNGIPKRILSSVPRAISGTLAGSRMKSIGQGVQSTGDYGQNSPAYEQENGYQGNNYGNFERQNNQGTTPKRILGRKQETKVLSEQDARRYLKAARGNRDLARRMAISDGWTISK